MNEPQGHAHAQSRDTDESVRENTAPVQLMRLTISDRTLSVVAIIFSCLALGAIIMHAILYPQIVDAKIEAGRAQAESTAKEARTTAKVTDDKLSELRDALNAKGMNLPKLDGHN